MIVFKQKTYSEYEAMRSLYVELMRDGGKRGKWEIISKSQLPAVLKGNNVVVEKFVISTSFFGRDKYRMYLKIGAKAKLPDEVRFPGYYYDEKLGGLSLKVTGGVPFKQNNFSDVKEKTFDNNKKNKNNGGGKLISTEYNNRIDVEVEVHNMIAEAIKYDKKARELILEFDTLQDAIRALNILPFGTNYNIKLLE